MSEAGVRFSAVSSRSVIERQIVLKLTSSVVADHRESTFRILNSRSAVVGAKNDLLATITALSSDHLTVATSSQPGSRENVARTEMSTSGQGPDLVWEVRALNLTDKSVPADG